MSGRALIYSLTLAIFVLATGASAFAADLSLQWPLGCTLGKDCWIAQYVDHDPTKGFQDFACGDRTYDGHDGTDIALRDHASIARNVPVYAAADGTVARIRDGVPDHYGTPADLDASKQSAHEAGNVVSLLHPDGWVTEYMHLKNGSIAVQKGQAVKAGQLLGFVGQTGDAQFAHLHFSARHYKDTIDPFSGALNKKCGENLSPLWRQPIAYEPFTIFAAGFSVRAPVDDDVYRDAASPASLPSKSSALIFWAAFYGAEPGDMIDMKIFDPAGHLYARNQSVLNKREARGLQYIGKKTAVAPLTPGKYTGQMTLTRTIPGKPTVSRTIEQSVEISD